MDPGTLGALAGVLLTLLSKLNDALGGYLERLKKKQQARQILMMLKDECDTTQVIASTIKGTIDKVSGQGSSDQDKLVNIIGLRVRELGPLVRSLSASIEDIFKLRDINKIGNALVDQEGALKRKSRNIKEKRQLIDLAVTPLVLGSTIAIGEAVKEIKSQCGLGVSIVKGGDKLSRELMDELEGGKRHHVIRDLLEKGADPNFLAIDFFSKKHPTAVSPLLCAMRDPVRRFEVVDTLLDNGALPDLVVADEPPLWQAFADGDVRLATRLLEAGADVNHLCLRGEGRGLLGATIVTLDVETASERRLELIQLALEYGASTETRAPNGNTPIHDAVEARHQAAEIIEMLCRGNAIIDAPGRDRLTPIMRAAQLGNQAANVVLLTYGAQPNIPLLENGPTAASIAEDAGHLDLVELYITFDRV